MQNMVNEIDDAHLVLQYSYMLIKKNMVYALAITTCKTPSTTAPTQGDNHEQVLADRKPAVHTRMGILMGYQFLFTRAAHEEFASTPEFAGFRRLPVYKQKVGDGR